VADVDLDAPAEVVVLDPPRTGAGTRVLSRLASLAPARIVSVSCDPATFARDARVLVDAGYALTAVTGVDQFTHTGHVELVGALTRATG
jgi:tRNA/tmRNA/rRNA uracil-C5-methylase (TrmA/RlmC/RlmD family)